MSSRAAEDTDGSDDDEPWHEGLQSLRASALAAWQRIDSQAELLLAIVNQLDTAEDLARAGAVCRAWRQIAREDALWEGVCSRSSSIPLLALLKSRPGCTLSWRQIFAQHRMAARVAHQLPAEPPAPPRSDYMLAVECRVDQPGRGSMVVHASLNELKEPVDEFPLFSEERGRLLQLRGLTSAGFGWLDDDDTGHKVRVSLLRKRDSKVMQLATQSEGDVSDDDSVLRFDASSTRLAALTEDQREYTTINLGIHWLLGRTPHDFPWRGLYDQQFLTGLDIDIDPWTQASKSHTVEDMLRAAERPEFAFRWV